MPDASDKLLIDACEVARLLSLNRSTVFSFHSSGRIGPLPIRLGRRTLWDRRQLEKWVQAGCPAREKWLEIRDSA